MWAALPLQPLKPWPPNAISIPKPPPRRHQPVPVYNLQNRNREEKGGLDLGGAVITALKTNQPRNQNAAKSKNRKPPEKQEERQLSGADVLMALEVVAAHKAKKKKEARDSSKGRDNNNNNKNNNNNNAERNRFRDFSNVKPLCIQPDWTGRLEELERRLQQLADI